MAARRHALNPAKVKADFEALENAPPAKERTGRPIVGGRLGVVLLNLLSVVLLTVAFAPYDQWYLAYLGLTPWVLAPS